LQYCPQRLAGAKIAAWPTAHRVGEELERAIKELPRDAEVVQLYKKMAGADPLPTR
jgi:hypothetical protein